MDEGSKRRKKKQRGRSLIFKTCFRPATSGDDNGGKILASDDNLVYCDVITPDPNVDQPEVKKSSSSRGRMSRLFKAVLFDTAMKKKMRGKRSSSKASFDSVNSSPGPVEKIDDPFDDTNPNNVKTFEADNSLNDTCSSKTDVLPVASLSSSVDNSSNNSATSHTLTEQKATPGVNSMDKKPPLIPSTSRSQVKPVHTKDSKHVALKSSSFRLYLFALAVVFVILVMLWKSYTAVGVKSLDVDSNEYTNIVVAGDEL